MLFFIYMQVMAEEVINFWGDLYCDYEYARVKKMLASM